MPLALCSPLFPVRISRMQDDLMARTRAGAAVRDRRLWLRLDQAELARNAEVDVKTLRSLEKGDRWPRDSTRSKIERALGWAPHSLANILLGAAPKRLPPEEQPPLSTALSTAEDARDIQLEEAWQDKESLRSALLQRFTEAPYIAKKFAEDPYTAADRVVKVTSAARSAFAAADDALQMGAEPVDVDRFVEEAFQLLSATGAFTTIAQLANGSWSGNVVGEYGNAKSLVQQHQFHPSTPSESNEDQRRADGASED